MMKPKTLNIYKVYYKDEFGDTCYFFIPAYTTDDAIKYSEETGIVVDFIQQMYVKEGFFFE